MRTIGEISKVAWEKSPPSPLMDLKKKIWRNVAAHWFEEESFCEGARRTGPQVLSSESNWSFMYHFWSRKSSGKLRTSVSRRKAVVTTNSHYFSDHDSVTCILGKKRWKQIWLLLYLRTLCALEVWYSEEVQSWCMYFNQTKPNRKD